MEFTKLVESMKVKRVKILKNLKTFWISTLFTQLVMVEYKILLMKMAIDGLVNYKAKPNFDLLWDL